MSLWQRPHTWLVMKKFAGMMPPTLVSADEGKNGFCGPAPSPSMFSGGRRGFAMRMVSGPRPPARDTPDAATATAASATAARRAPPIPARPPFRWAAIHPSRTTAPRVDVPMWA